MTHEISRQAALLVIDMQKGMQADSLPRRNNVDAEDNIGALLDAWRETKRPVVHVRHISRSPESVFRPGQRGAEFQARFAPLAPEHVVEKNVPDAFAATGLERWMRVREIGQLVVTGVATNNSVESTARTAGNLGFATIVASDATFAFDQCDLAGRVWVAEDVHMLSLTNLALDYASIHSSAEILSVLA